jgi:hypothetical protein
VSNDFLAVAGAPRRSFLRPFAFGGKPSTYTCGQSTQHSLVLISRIGNAARRLVKCCSPTKQATTLLS